MGKYGSDDDRRKSRKKHRRSSGSRSRSRGRRLSREHSRRRSSRSRSRSYERRRRSRERHRDSTGRRSTRRRSTSKSTRGKHSNSRSLSRSRSRGHRSRSRSYDKERKREKKERDNKYTVSKTSKSSEKRPKEDDTEENHLAIKDSTPYIPSADVLAKIESNSFSPETFISQRLGKDDKNGMNSHQEQSHENAIFGISGTEKTTVHKPVEITHESRKEETGIMASVLHEQEEDKNDRWLKKLHSMRQKKLLDSSDK